MRWLATNFLLVEMNRLGVLRFIRKTIKTAVLNEMYGDAGQRGWGEIGGYTIMYYPSAINTCRLPEL